MQLPPGWFPVDDESAARLEAELRRELPSGHVLHKRLVRAVARRQDRDDVLFRSSEDEAVYCVHLTWSVERDPEWPGTEAYANMDDFLERWPREEG
jgi:hypothetical protein